MRRDGAHQRRGAAVLWADLRRRIDKAAYARQNAEGEFEGRPSWGRPRRSWPATLSPCTSGISRPCERSPRSATSPPPSCLRRSRRTIQLSERPTPRGRHSEDKGAQAHREPGGGEAGKVGVFLPISG